MVEALLDSPSLASGPSLASELLTVTNLSKNFGGVQAIDDLSFSVGRGQIAALIGPNGAGKTTAFNLISGVFPLDMGCIWLNGRMLNGLPSHAVSALGVGRTFQNLQMFGNLTALENVAVGRHQLSKAGLLSSALRLPGSRREEQNIFAHARSYLDLVGLSDRANHLAAYLPFGQQRLLEIARALAAEPLLLLLDEPGAGLNSAETDRLAHLIVRIRDSGTTVLLVEHDMALVMSIADHIVVLDYGRKIADGAPEEVQNDAHVIAAYLGEELSELELKPSLVKE